jgi:hypothetical protein
MTTATNLPTLRVPADACLADNKQWTNRFEIRSSSSGRVYRVAQHKTGRYWGCSCPSYCYGRKGSKSCKHLSALSLTGNYVAQEVKIEAVSAA